MFQKLGKSAQAGAFSYIGAEVVVTGDIATEGELHIDGKVEGDVSCGSLTQGPGGAVHGNIAAGEAKLAGLVDGAVEAGSLTLAASARVTGDILYETVAVAAGAEVEGRLKRRRGGAEGSSIAKAARALKAERRESAQPPAPTPLFGGPAEVQAAE